MALYKPEDSQERQEAKKAAVAYLQEYLRQEEKTISWLDEAASHSRVNLSRIVNGRILPDATCGGYHKNPGYNAGLIPLINTRRRLVIMKALIQSVKNLFKKGMQCIQHNFIKWTVPANSSQVKGTILNLTRSKAALIAENALLRQQLLVLQRQVKQTHFKPLDRFVMVVLASWFNWWRQALLIVKPDTLMRWHRLGFRQFWKLKSKPKGSKPKISEETVALIKQMAAENRLWRAERHPLSWGPEANY